MELYETLKFAVLMLSIDFCVVTVCGTAVKIAKAICGRMVFKNTHIARMEINQEEQHDRV